MGILLGDISDEIDEGVEMEAILNTDDAEFDIIEHLCEAILVIDDEVDDDDETLREKIDEYDICQI